MDEILEFLDKAEVAGKSVMSVIGSQVHIYIYIYIHVYL
jgi:DNA-binding ferritin-like protein (Dps family)